MKQSAPTKPISASRAKPSSMGASPVQVFGIAAVFGAGLLVFIYQILFEISQDNSAFVAIGVGLYLAGTILAGFHLNADFPHQSLGLCNLATLGRLVIVGVLCIVVLAGVAPSWATFTIAVIALALDGIDGWLARWQGLSSEFGARFDVEVDAAFALVLAIYAATNGAAGPFVILLGLPHYLFWIARLQLPWLNQPLRPSFSRKAVCVFQIGALIALQVPFFASGQLNLLIGAVTLALLWSFGRDILWLWQTR